MGKVYVVYRTDSFDITRIMGICETKTKAEVVVKLLERYGYEKCNVESFKIDGVLEDLKDLFNQDMTRLREAENLLKELNDEES